MTGWSAKVRISVDASWDAIYGFRENASGTASFTGFELVPANGALPSPDEFDDLRKRAEEKAWEAGQKLLNETDWFLYVDGVSVSRPLPPARRGRKHVSPLKLAQVAKVQAELSADKSAMGDMDTRRADELRHNPDHARRLVTRARASGMLDRSNELMEKAKWLCALEDRGVAEDPRRQVIACSTKPVTSLAATYGLDEATVVLIQNVAHTIRALLEPKPSQAETLALAETLDLSEAAVDALHRGEAGIPRDPGPTPFGRAVLELVRPDAREGDDEPPTGVEIHDAARQLGVSPLELIRRAKTRANVLPTGRAA